MSSRSIEEQNSLYLPYVKVYGYCCSISSCVRSAELINDLHDLEISMGTSRDKLSLYQETTSTPERVRTVSEVVGCYINHNAIPDFSRLLTATSIVPDDRFTLQKGKIVAIEINAIGTLTNLVV